MNKPSYIFSVVVSLHLVTLDLLDLLRVGQHPGRAARELQRHQDRVVSVVEGFAAAAAVAAADVTDADVARRR